jgi:hypothetical protein
MLNSTKLERAQLEFDRAILLQERAETDVNDRRKAVSTARQNLEQAKREAAAEIPVDRTARQLSGGGAVTEDHRDIKDNGQQKGYVVLTAAERAKGFVQPVRRTYVHKKCGVATTMSQDLAETYARDPKFYSGTFCCGCRKHFTFGAEDGDFVWDDGSKVGS